MAPGQIVEKEGLGLVSDIGALEAAVEAVLKANPKVLEYQAGKRSINRLFRGQVMRGMGGKADPKAVRELLLKALAVK